MGYGGFGGQEGGIGGGRGGGKGGYRGGYGDDRGGGGYNGGDRFGGKGGGRGYGNPLPYGGGGGGGGGRPIAFLGRIAVLKENFGFIDCVDDDGEQLGLQHFFAFGSVLGKDKVPKLGDEVRYAVENDRRSGRDAAVRIEILSAGTLPKPVEVRLVGVVERTGHSGRIVHRPQDAEAAAEAAAAEGGSGGASAGAGTAASGRVGSYQTATPTRRATATASGG